MKEENKTSEKQQGGNDLITDAHISVCSVDCPECKKKGCDFCSGIGLIYFYPSPDAYDHIEISRAKWRISQRSKI
jgi:hypothetical protein